MDTQGKNILITGGAKGIGFIAAKTLINKGSNVGITDIDELTLKSAKSILGDKVWTKVSDVSNMENCKNTIDEFCYKFGYIDILVNNAAFIYNSPLISVLGGVKIHDTDAWLRVVNTNLNGVFYLTSLCVEKMLKKRVQGLIINMSSVCANGNPGQSAYSASKAAVEAATKSWAKELSAFNIRFACVAPGYVETETTLSILTDSVKKDIQNKIPLRRFAKVDEVIDSLLFIIGNDYFNGKVLSLDGGLVI